MFQKASHPTWQTRGTRGDGLRVSRTAGGVMVWACYSAQGKRHLTFVTNKVDYIRYTEVLRDFFLPNIEGKNLQKAVFQQDNGPCYSSKHTKSCSMDNFVSILEWPASYPYLSLIENLCGILSQDVYKNAHHFVNEGDLSDAIIHRWENIPLETLKKLATSKLKRCIVAVEKQGGETRY